MGNTRGWGVSSKGLVTHSLHASATNNMQQSIRSLKKEKKKGQRGLTISIIINFFSSFSMLYGEINIYYMQRTKKNILTQKNKKKQTKYKQEYLYHHQITSLLDYYCATLSLVAAITIIITGSQIVDPSGCVAIFDCIFKGQDVNVILDGLT